jgi:hypothetical protein
MKTDLEHGDRLISLTHEYSNPASPTGLDETTYLAGKFGCRQITVGRIPGPHDWVLTGQVTFEDQRPDLIVPLYKAARFEVQYDD